jgi:hypothetical protein
MTQYLEDYSKLEEVVTAFLRALVSTCAGEVSGLRLDAHEQRELVTKLVWRFVSTLDGTRILTAEDGRPILASLGLIVQGSGSAFEEPFVEHEGMLVTGRVSLHEYVHLAVDQVLGQAPQGS